MRQAQVFVYANGNDNAPTAIELKKPLLKDLFFNQTPAKVIMFCFPPFLTKLTFIHFDLNKKNRAISRSLCLCCKQSKSCSLIIEIKKNSANWSFHYPNSGCSFSICFDETDTLPTCTRKASSFRHKVWIGETVLHTDSERQCHTRPSPGELDREKPSGTGLLSQRCRSFPIFLKTSGTA